MIPQDKARELVQEFRFRIDEYFQPVTWEELKDHNIKLDKAAKDSAILAVDEIILSRKDDSQFDDTSWAGGSDMYTMHPIYLKYWLEVKKEIEAL